MQEFKYDYSNINYMRELRELYNTNPYTSYEDFEEYDLINANEIIKNDLFINSTKTYYGESGDEYVILNHKYNDNRIGLPKCNFDRVSSLIHDRMFTPSLVDEKSYKEFKINSYDMNKKELRIPTYETLYENGICIITYPNFRYYEEELNSTYILASKAKMYDCFDSIDWDFWHVILCITESTIKDGAYIIRGVPKQEFLKFKLKEY